MNQPIQENKEVCKKCVTDWNTKMCDCKCHTPQPKEVQNTSREEVSEPTLRDWEERFLMASIYNGFTEWIEGVPTSWHSSPEKIKKFMENEFLLRDTALLEFIDGQDAGKNDLYDEDYIVGFNEAKSIIASHIRNGS